ncbi:hypothetical protein PBF_06451 [Cytobacillus firmus DS1]|uniref:Uncharacterized protein n=1 Tax=Cytobacillus firmus DS1 TaxID=1307436 RepID=W7L9A0_CYTFI|nr:hypothetical protein PBF_06451 [Cytobacillus firmus DS1]
MFFILHFPLKKWLFSQGLLLFSILFTELIGTEGERSSKMLPHFLRAVFIRGYLFKYCGSSGTGETPQTRSVGDAHRLPRGKRAPWSGNPRTALKDGNQ